MPRSVSGEPLWIELLFFEERLGFGTITYPLGARVDYRLAGDIVIGGPYVKAPVLRRH